LPEPVPAEPIRFEVTAEGFLPYVTYIDLLAGVNAVRHRLVKPNEWVVRETPNIDIMWGDIAYGNGVTVAFGMIPEERNLFIMTSYNSGETWTMLPPVDLAFVPYSTMWLNPAPHYMWQTGVFVNFIPETGRFVVGASANMNAAIVLYSADGTSWTQPGGILRPGNARFSDITFGNGVYVMVGSTTIRPSYEAPSHIFISTDLINWQGSSVPVQCEEERTSWWSSIVFTGDMFVISAWAWTVQSGEFPLPPNSAISFDGLNWHLITGTGGTRVSTFGLVYGNGRIVAPRPGAMTINSVPYPFFLTTNDGVNWRNVVARVPEAIDGIFVTAAFGNDVFVLIGYSGVADDTISIIVYEGEIIDLVSVPTPLRQWSAATSDSNGRFIAVAATGSPYQRVMTLDWFGSVGIAPATFFAESIDDYFIEIGDFSVLPDYY
jgi:hypothetical protein